MATNTRPFLAEQRRDVLSELITSRNELIQRNVVALVSRGINPSAVKLDGKAGAADGVIGIANSSDFLMPVPIQCDHYEPEPPPKHKEEKDGKEMKEGKEGKEGKEAKESKEGKDTSDGFKAGGDEVQNPFTRYGDWNELPGEAFNAIARAFPEVLQAAIARGVAVF